MKIKIASLVMYQEYDPRIEDEDVEFDVYGCIAFGSNVTRTTSSYLVQPTGSRTHLYLHQGDAGERQRACLGLPM